MDKSKFVNVCTALLFYVFLMTTVVIGAEVGAIDGNTCKTDLDYFETLPGTGFDNLRNEDMGQVVLNSYEKCRTTNDRKYIVPDDVTIIPIKHSKAEVFSELYEHWYNYTSTTSNSINAGASLFGIISGSFSDENEFVKTQQVYDQSSTTRVQVRHHLYKARTDNPILHPTFKSRVMDICANFQNNDTRMARYLTQKLIRDYGTHVVTVVDVGGVYLQLDQIKNTFVNNFYLNKHTVRAAASFSFWEISAGGGFSSSSSQTMNEYYRTNRTDSKFETHGGDPYRVNQTINEWQDGLPNNLVAINKYGDPLNYVVTPETLPDIPGPTVTHVSKLIYKEIKRYYDVNTHKGCIDMDSENFNFRANTDDGSCIAPYNNYTFGGVYQTCEMKPGSNAGDMCPGLSQKNPLTGDYTCQSGYEAVQLNAGEEHHTASRQECHRHCILFIFCHTSCGTIYLSSTAFYNTFWCVATGPVPADTGYLFGGVYTSTMPNPLTETQACPNTFYPLRMGSDLFVCVNDDYELGYRYSVPFAGFFSCSAGNPLSLDGKTTYASDSISKEPVNNLAMFLKEGGPSSWPQRCPSGYSQHLAAIDNDCRIDFCVKANALSGLGLPKINRPPYTRKPNRNPNTTETWYVVGTQSNVWVKNMTTMQWKLMVYDDPDSFRLPGSPVPTDKAKTNTDSSNKSNVSMIVGVTIAVIAFVVIAMLVASTIRKRRRGFNGQNYQQENRPNNYNTLHGDQPNETAPIVPITTMS
ncbi:macrophage-expressed gene 1 protein-like [Antedon mediterranea]|uniref:macrophage-expressed gene 1 protein-like n=1 Tax=Antedon mediterranea TaxID=105859 RepID=UPI003AF4EBB4